MFYQNKDIYSGTWCKNEYHDTGTFYLAESQELFIGKWQNGDIVEDDFKILGPHGKAQAKDKYSLMRTSIFQRLKNDHKLKEHKNSKFELLTNSNLTSN